jgi:hypothetical protein
MDPEQLGEMESVLLIEQYMNPDELAALVKDGWSDSVILDTLLEHFGQQPGISIRSIRRMKNKHSISKWTRLPEEQAMQIVSTGVAMVI